MAEKKLYRACVGWLEKKVSGDEGIIFVQHGREHESLDEAIEQAREIEGWVEEYGVRAHVPTRTKITIEQQ